MALIVWSDVVAVAPTLAGTATQTQDSVLAFANARLSPAIFGGEDSAIYKMARVYLVAHLIELGSRPLGTSGPVSSKSVSPSSMSVSYAASSGGAELSLTQWGTLLQQLTKSRAAARMPTTW